MKRSFLLVMVLALLLAAGWLAPVFKSDPGLVVINLGEWTLETSVLVLATAFLLLWLIVQVIAWLWRMPVNAARRVSEQRAYKQLEKGLLALTEGDWRAAERALEKSASAQGRTTAHYLAAAHAADSQDAPERREYYLEQADSGGSKKRFLVELTRARLLLANGNRATALPILQDLHARRRKHPQVLELLARCYRELGEWDELQALLPALRKADVLDDEQLQALREEVAVRKLQSVEDAEALLAAWKKLPRPMRRHPAVADAYAETASGLERPDLAEPVIVASLKDKWAPGLVLRYGDPASGDRLKRLKQCEKWLKQRPDDAALHLALGRLCAGESLWGKAREHMVRSLEIEPSSLGYDAFGQLLEHQGEMEMALACFRNALRMNQGKQPEPLPTDSPRLPAS
ncbi:MAG: heme biosynthesis HemY N-terminal domain-containing protein [Lysobacterales bacterium]|jgi:HemY protein